MFQVDIDANYLAKEDCDWISDGSGWIRQVKVALLEQHKIIESEFDYTVVFFNMPTYCNTVVAQAGLGANKMAMYTCDSSGLQRFYHEFGHSLNLGHAGLTEFYTDKPPGI